MLLQASAPITGVASRATSSRGKQSVTSTSSLLSSKGRLDPSKFRPVTAPSTTNVQSRTQRPVALLPTQPSQSTTITTAAAAAPTKVRSKPVASTVRRSSLTSTVSPSSNLQRQSTSTGSSTSSLSSTNTQGSLPCTHSDTPTTTNSTTTILRSTSNGIISSPINPNTKSRIPIRAILPTITKKSST